MVRMLKLWDMGILKHHTKKEGGTFSFFALGCKYNDLIDKSFSERPNLRFNNFKGRDCDYKELERKLLGC